MDHLNGKSFLELKNCEGQVEIIEAYRSSQTAELQNAIDRYKMFAKEIRVKHFDYLLKTDNYLELAQEYFNPRVQNISSVLTSHSDIQAKEKLFLQQIGKHAHALAALLRIPKKRLKAKPPGTQPGSPKPNSA